MERRSTWIPRPFKFSDWSFHKLYGSAPRVPLSPLGRDISMVPVTYQGMENTCVSCAVTWIKMWQEANKVDLSHEYLAKEAGTTEYGAEAGWVLDAAKNIGICEQSVWDTAMLAEAMDSSANGHRIIAYAYLHSLSKEDLYFALGISPIMVGVNDFQGVGPHMLAAFDVTEDGKRLRCANWWVQDSQEIVEVPFEDVTFACSILKEKPETKLTMNPIYVLLSKAKDAISTGWYKLKTLARHNISKMIAGLLVGTGMVGGAAGIYGSSGIVARFNTTVASGITNTASVIPVASLTLPDGEIMTTSNVTYPLYLTINPTGSTAEDVECWGISGNTFTGCNRGLSWLGGSTTSTVTTLRFPHSQGEKVIMSNTPYFYNRFVDITAAQTIRGVKTFVNNIITQGSITTGNTGLKVGASNAGIGFNGTDLTWTSDGSNVYSFSAAAPSILLASSTRGIGITDSKIYVNASTTASNNGGYLKFGSSDGKLYWDVTSFLAKTGLSFASFSYQTASTTPVTNGRMVDYVSAYYFGDGSDGDVTISSPTTLTADMFYNNLTIATGTVVNAGGYKIYVKRTAYIRGTLHNNGGNGADATTPAGGAGGATTTQGTLGSGTGGAAGVHIAGCATQGNGKASSALTSALGSVGGNGGTATKGGTGTGGTAGTVTTSKTKPRSPSLADPMLDYGATTLGVLRGGGGGASGGLACSAGGSDTSSGGGGAGGGIVFLSAKILSLSGTVSANGGNGGRSVQDSGGTCNSSATNASGGSGGGGGGYVYIRYVTKVGNGTATANGGTKSVDCPGSGGTASGVTDGTAGVVNQVQIQ